MLIIHIDDEIDSEKWGYWVKDSVKSFVFRK